MLARMVACQERSSNAPLVLWTRQQKTKRRCVFPKGKENSPWPIFQPLNFWGLHMNLYSILVYSIWLWLNKVWNTFHFMIRKGWVRPGQYRLYTLVLWLMAKNVVHVFLLTTVVRCPCCKDLDLRPKFGDSTKYQPKVVGVSCFCFWNF